MAGTLVLAARLPWLAERDWLRRLDYPGYLSGIGCIGLLAG